VGTRIWKIRPVSVVIYEQSNGTTKEEHISENEKERGLWQDN